MNKKFLICLIYLSICATGEKPSIDLGTLEETIKAERSNPDIKINFSITACQMYVQNKISYSQLTESLTDIKTIPSETQIDTKNIFASKIFNLLALEYALKQTKYDNIINLEKALHTPAAHTFCKNLNIDRQLLITIVEQKVDILNRSLFAAYMHDQLALKDIIKNPAWIAKLNSLQPYIHKHASDLSPIELKVLMILLIYTIANHTADSLIIHMDKHSLGWQSPKLQRISATIISDKNRDDKEQKLAKEKTIYSDYINRTVDWYTLNEYIKSIISDWRLPIQSTTVLDQQYYTISNTDKTQQIANSALYELALYYAFLPNNHQEKAKIFEAINCTPIERSNTTDLYDLKNIRTPQQHALCRAYIFRLSAYKKGHIKLTDIAEIKIGNVNLYNHKNTTDNLLQLEQEENTNTPNEHIFFIALKAFNKHINDTEFAFFYPN